MFVRSGDLEMFFIVGTTLVTVFLSLNYAVISFTVLFHALRHKYGAEKVRDLSAEESKHAADSTALLADQLVFSTAGAVVTD